MLVYLVRRISHDDSSEKLLLATIIRRAAYDIALYKHSTQLSNQRLCKDAMDWVFDSERRDFTSFLNVCDVLNQCPEDMRKKVMRLTSRDVRKYDMVDCSGRVHQ